MNKLFGELLTAYALYTLSGAGLVFIYFVCSCWYITVVWGWIALGIYLVVWWIVVECLIRALLRWMNKNSSYADNKPLEQTPHVKEVSIRKNRHGY
jgi:hypothetical protein